MRKKGNKGKSLRGRKTVITKPSEKYRNKVRIPVIIA